MINEWWTGRNVKGDGLHPIWSLVLTPAWKDGRKLENKSLDNIQSPSLKRRPFKYDAGTLTTSVRNRGRQRERERELGQTNYVTLMSECCVGPDQDSLVWVVGCWEASDIMPMCSACYGRLTNRSDCILWCRLRPLRTTAVGNTTLQGLSSQEPARYSPACLNSYFRTRDQV
jgi:hypothetical protein